MLVLFGESLAGARALGDALLAALGQCDEFLCFLAALFVRRTPALVGHAAQIDDASGMVQHGSASGKNAL